MRKKLEQQLMAELSRKNIDFIVHWIIENTGAEKHLVDILLSHEDKLPQRAAWAMEKLSEKKAQYFKNEIPVIIDALPNIPASSTRRTIAKVIMLHDIPIDYEGKVLDFCINILESVKEPVAVKANCMTIVFNLLPKYPDLRNEIYAIIENQIPHNTVAFSSRYHVLKKKLKQA